MHWAIRKDWLVLLEIPSKTDQSGGFKSQESRVRQKMSFLPCAKALHNFYWLVPYSIFYYDKTGLCCSLSLVLIKKSCSRNSFSFPRLWIFDNGKKQLHPTNPPINRICKFVVFFVTLGFCKRFPLSIERFPRICY